MDKLPKDLAAAKRGYEAFYEESPNIWFEDLAPHYQMRWVRAARAIVEELKNYTGPGRPNGTVASTFWEDAEQLPPEEFLEKWVTKSSAGRFQFHMLQAREKKEAMKIAKRLSNRRWAEKQHTKT